MGLPRAPCVPGGPVTAPIQSPWELHGAGHLCASLGLSVLCDQVNMCGSVSTCIHNCLMLYACAPNGMYRGGGVYISVVGCTCVGWHA